MKRDRAKELLPVIEAFAEGKEVECLQRCSPDHWSAMGDYCQFQSGNSYRIKPEPEVIWVTTFSSEDRVVSETLGGSPAGGMTKKFIAVE